MPNCSRCAATPGDTWEAGVLYIAPPLAHTAGSLRVLLKSGGVSYTEPARDVLAVPLGPGVLKRLADDLGRELSRGELRDTRSVLIDDGATLGPQDLAAMQPLSMLVAQVQGAWFAETLREGRLTSHFQPIVHASRRAEVFAHECLLRGVDADGGLIAPGRMYEAARDADMLFALDRAARLTAIREAAAHGLGDAGTHLFINFNPTSIYDPVFCLQSTVAAIAGTSLRSERIVFEIVESDRIEDIGHLQRIITFYRSAGFKIALDDLGSGYGSLNLLGELRPDFVKLDMQLIRGVDCDPFKAGIVAKLLEMARDLGVETVAEGIESEGEWEWVREHGADYAQGYWFARPGSPPPTPRSESNRVACCATGVSPRFESR